MAKMLRAQKQIILLVITFVFSSLYRTVVGVWPFGSPLSLASHRSFREPNGLLVCPYDGNSGSEGAVASDRFALEINGSFPFLHLHSMSVESISVALSHAPYLSGLSEIPELNAMQAGSPFAPLGQASCPAPPQTQAFFPSSTPTGNVTVQQTWSPIPYVTSQIIFGPAGPANTQPQAEPVAATSNPNNPNWPCTDSGCGGAGWGPSQNSPSD
jgi:hypothetical protein